MKKAFIILVLVAFFAASLAYAEAIPIKNIWQGKTRLMAREESTGKLLWQSEVQVQKIEHNGQPALHIFEEGARFSDKESNYASWNYESYSRLEGTKILPDQIKIVFKNGKGEIFKILNKFFDYENKKIICKVNGENEEFEFNDDIVDKENLGIYLSNFPFGMKKEFSFHLLNHDPALQKMIIRYKGKEDLKIGKNVIKCHKLEMIPDLGALNLLDVFIPKIYFWYEVEAPHNFVKYQGLENGLGTPYIILESQVLAGKSG